MDQTFWWWVGVTTFLSGEGLQKYIKIGMDKYNYMTCTTCLNSAFLLQYESSAAGYAADQEE